MWIVKLWLPLSFCVSIHTENQLTKKKWQINSMNYNLLNFWYYVLILFGKKSCCNLWQIVGGDLFLSDQAVLVFRNGSYGLKKLRSIFCVYCILFKLVGWIKKKKQYSWVTHWHRHLVSLIETNGFELHIFSCHFVL